MKARILFVIVMVLALMLPSIAVSAAPSSTPTWTSGRRPVLAKLSRPCMKYRHLTFQPAKNWL